MAFRPLTQDLRQTLGRRVLISGPPNSRKTTSLHTWPRPNHIMSYPGEKGHDSIDLTMEGIHAYIWEFDEVTKVSPAAVVTEIENTTWKILGGKQYGPITTFSGDGLHKLYGWYYLRARNELEGANIPDDTKDARAYGMAHDDFTLYLTKVNQSKVPYVVFTVWDGKEPDSPELKSKSPTHIFPDLPGKMAKRIMGEFSVVLYANVGLPKGPGQSAPAMWQLQPAGSVWGAGVKIPARLAMGLPQTVPQDWATLEKLLTDAR